MNEHEKTIKLATRAYLERHITACDFEQAVDEALSRIWYQEVQAEMGERDVSGS